MTDPGREPDARARDAADPLTAYRDRFLLPDGPDGPDGPPAIYFAGQSLGLQARTVRPAIEAELDAWAHRGVEGHFDAGRPWFTADEAFRAPMARLVGARPSEVAVLNTLTVNLQLMLASFFRPAGARRRILTDAPIFPSDRHAYRSHLAWRGLDPDVDLIAVGPRAGEDTLRIDDLEAAIAEHGPSLALVALDGVNFATGQALPVARLTEAGHRAGAMVGWDLAHAVGNVPLTLHDDGVDFAVWCTYKYLNGGPGSVGSIFVHERHTAPGTPEVPRLTGWWGATPERRFDPDGPFVPDTGAAAWKMSTSPLFNMLALEASLAIFDEVGLPALRERSVRLTGYLAGLLEARGVEILTPSDPAQRGAQLSLRFTNAPAVLEALTRQGVIADFRAPDIIRVAPVPLSCTFLDAWRFAAILDGILARSSA
jgi:kynureninase